MGGIKNGNSMQGFDETPSLSEEIEIVVVHKVKDVEGNKKYAKNRRSSSKFLLGTLKNPFRLASRKKSMRVATLETEIEENTKGIETSRGNGDTTKHDPPETVSRSSQIRHNLFNVELY